MTVMAAAIDATVAVGRRRIDAVSMLSFYILLVVIVPAWLVYSPLGAAGAPAALFALLLFCSYLLIWLHPGLAPARGSQPVRRAALFFGAVILASYVAVNRLPLPVLQLNSADRSILSTCGWLGVLLLAADGIQSMDRLDVLLRRVVMATTAVASLAILQFFSGIDLTRYMAIPGLSDMEGISPDVLTRAFFNRPAATTLSPIELAGVLVMVLPIAIHQARYAPADRRFRRWMQVAAISAAIPLTLSRTAFTALAAVCIILLPFWPRRDRRIAYLVGIGGVIACYLAIPGLIGTFVHLFVQTGSVERTSAFSLAAPFIAQHPLFGLGTGTLLPTTYFYTDDQYLNSLVQTGFIGLLGLLALFIVGMSRAIRARRRTADCRRRDLSLSLAAAIAASAVSFATLDALSFPIIAGLTFLVIGCAGAIWRLSAEDEGGRRS